jgi:hypothetical protein
MATCRLGNRHQLRHRRRARFAAVTERELSQDHQGTQRSLGKIVRRRDASVIDEDQLLGVMTIDSALQDDCFGMSHRELT